MFSGLDCDPVHRKYEDTWKVAEMAAFGNYVIADVKPFTHPSNYSSSLYRDQINKPFRTKDAITCVFEYKKFERLLTADQMSHPLKWPTKFEHDISLWIDDSDVTDDELQNVLVQFLDHVFDSIRLLEAYKHANGRMSKCYRVVHCTKYCALSKHVSNQLQDELRDKLRDLMHNKVTVR